MPLNSLNNSKKVLYYFSKFVPTLSKRSAAEYGRRVCLFPDKLTCDLLTVKMMSKSCVTWATSLKMLVFQSLSVLELFSMHATDRRQRMYAELEGNPQNWTGLGHHSPCSWGVPDTIEMCPFTHVLILLPDQTVCEILSKSV